MASKKCSKCGEDNPVECTICWACYTPLEGVGSGGFVHPNATVGAKPSQINDPNNELTKKETDPKMFVIGGLLLLGVVIAITMKTGFLSGNHDSPADVMIPTNPSGAINFGTSPQFRSLPGSGSSNSNVVPIAAVALPYNVVVPPNPRYATGTLGILATQQNLSHIQAGGLAKFARDQFTRNGKWTGMQIAVFSDPAAAKQFASYQAKRRGAPLNVNDYQHLAYSNIWMGAPAFYQSSGKKESISYPSSNPMSWWI